MSDLFSRWGHDATVLVISPVGAHGDDAAAAVTELERAIATAAWFERRADVRARAPIDWCREGSVVVGVFASVDDAVEEALAALGNPDGRDRCHAPFSCGVGSGPVIVGDGCDVHGPPAHRARRLAALAAAGDLWIDEETSRRVDLPAGVGRHPSHATVQRLAGFPVHEVRDYR